MSAALLGLALLAGPAVAEPAELVLQADRIVLAEGVVHGEGHVRAALFEGELEAASFTVREDGAGLLIEDGTWLGPAGRLRFAHLEVEADGTVRLDHARVTRCACEGDHQPWALQARRVRVDPERRVVFVGGLLRVAGCPLLPLPAGVLPLGPRRAGLLTPQVGWTRDGLEVGEPLFLPLGPAADLTLTPIWRQHRGARLAGEARWALPADGGGHLAGEAGWDTLDGRWRGLLSGQHGAQDRALRSAFEGSLASDQAYLQDYAPDFLSRQVGFHEARALVAVGPWRLEHDGFQAPEGVAQRLAGLSFTRAARDPEGISPSVALDLEVGGRGPDRLDLDEAWLALRGAAGLDAARPLGALEASAGLGVDGLLVEPLDLAGGAVGRGEVLGRLDAEGRLVLPMWGDHGRLRHLLRPGLVAGGALASPTPLDDTWPTLPAGPAWWTGPEVESRWLTSQGVPMHLRAAVPWTDAGLQPALQAWGRRGAWWGRAMVRTVWAPGGGVSDGVAWLDAGRDGEALDLAAGLLMLQDTADASQATGRLAWRLPWGADTWRPRIGARLSLDDGQLIEEQVGLSFDSRCGCLGIDVAATFAEDLAWPGVKVGLSFGR
ncbi:MAG: hypothetical protein ABIO70_08695 [Pseudomonadota bacterium]